MSTYTITTHLLNCVFAFFSPFNFRRLRRRVFSFRFNSLCALFRHFTSSCLYIFACTMHLVTYMYKEKKILFAHLFMRMPMLPCRCRLGRAQNGEAKKKKILKNAFSRLSFSLCFFSAVIQFVAKHTHTHTVVAMLCA